MRALKYCPELVCTVLSSLHVYDTGTECRCKIELDVGASTGSIGVVNRGGLSARLSGKSTSNIHF